jgi:hypothetical protein
MVFLLLSKSRQEFVIGPAARPGALGDQQLERRDCPRRAANPNSETVISTPHATILPFSLCETLSFERRSQDGIGWSVMSNDEQIKPRDKKARRARRLASIFDRPEERERALAFTLELDD